jgi:hypothetical protein
MDSAGTREIPRLAGENASLRDDAKLFRKLRRKSKKDSPEPPKPSLNPPG